MLYEVITGAAPCLCRLLPVAAVAGAARARPHGRAWHARMAAGEIGRALGGLLARGADSYNFV